MRPTTRGSVKKARTTMDAEHLGHFSAFTSSVRRRSSDHGRRRRRGRGGGARHGSASAASAGGPGVGSACGSSCGTRAGSSAASDGGSRGRNRERLVNTPWYLTLCVNGRGSSYGKHLEEDAAANPVQVTAAVSGDSLLDVFLSGDDAVPGNGYDLTLGGMARRRGGPVVPHRQVHGNVGERDRLVSRLIHARRSGARRPRRLAPAPGPRHGRARDL